MNVLPFDKQVTVVSLLVRGNSIRKTAEQACVHRDTVMRLLCEIGTGCTHLHNQRVRNLESSIIEVDEIWSFIRKKQSRLKPGDPVDWGDHYTFVALDALSKLVVSYHVGKRQAPEAEKFANDIYARLVVEPQITSDGWRPYIQALESAFGAGMNYSMLVKMIDILDQLQEAGGQPGQPYSQIQVNEAVRTIITGNPNPAHITTTHVERQNLTIRMDCRRFSRKTLAHSKTLQNHKAAIALHFAYYNFCRVHETIRVTPAMETGLATEVWTVADLIQQAKAATSLVMAKNQAAEADKNVASDRPLVPDPNKQYGVPLF
jgi:IS1 family transposase